MVLPVLELFRQTQTLLEGRKYVTGYSVVSFIYDLREGLEAAVEGLNNTEPGGDPAVFTA